MNESQKKAVLHDGNLLIVAGPGTGKTFTLTHKIAHTLQFADLSSIVAITFTCKAADAMQERLKKLLQVEISSVHPLPFVGTFHAFALKILREHNDLMRWPKDFSVLDSAMQFGIFKKEARAIRNTLSDSAIRKMMHIFSLSKNQNIPLESMEIPDSILLDELLSITAVYQHHLSKMYALDFDDILLQALNLLRGNPDVQHIFHRTIQHLFIDEYQDVNEVQYQFIRTLLGEKSRICAIGDPDQAIYGFRGACVDHFFRFSSDFPDATILYLEENYRSSPIILDAAEQLIQCNAKRMQRSLRTSRVDKIPVTVFSTSDPWKEAECICKEIQSLMGGMDMIEAGQKRDYAFSEYSDFHFSDFAVLYRTKSQGRLLEASFKKAGIPYQMVGGTPWHERKEIQTLLLYIRAILHPDERQPETFNARLKNILSTSNLWLQHNIESMKPSDIVKMILKECSLESSQNILLFLSLVTQFDSHIGSTGLMRILEYFALLQEQDDYDPNIQAVSLMTLHASKGLEFPIVFIAGLEDGLLPYRTRSDISHESNAFSDVRNDPVVHTDIEEERRLFYVGMTRSKQKLYLLHSFQRDHEDAILSPFLSEIPSHFLEKHEKKRRKTASSQKSQRSFL